MCFQVAPLQISLMVAFPTLNWIATSLIVFNPFNFLICITCKSFKIELLCASPIGCKPFFTACIWFSDWLHHSKFSTRLSLLIPLMWLTCGLFSGFGINACATNLWTVNDFLLLFLHKLNVEYPYLSILLFKYIKFFL